MHILFEAIRAVCKRGMLIIYDHGLHARREAIIHPHLAAPYSCRQHLPNDSYKDALLPY